MPKSQDGSWLDQLRRLIEESKKLTPRKMTTPRVSIDEYNRLNGLRKEILKCLRRIGPCAADLLAQEMEHAWFIRVFPDTADTDGYMKAELIKKPGPPLLKFHGQERIYVEHVAIRGATEILKQAEKRIQKVLEIHKPKTVADDGSPSRSTGSPQSAQAFRDYLDRNSLTLGDFARDSFPKDSKVSEKTLRKFARTGMARKSVFRDIAKAMGISTQQLRNGDLPPLEKH